MLLDLDCVRAWRKMFVAMYDATVDNVPTVRQKEVVCEAFVEGCIWIPIQ